MKKIILLILLLPVTAIAGHHRGHALDNIETIHVHFNQLLKHLAIYEDSCTLAEADQKSVDVIFAYTDSMIIQLDNVANAINAGSLDDARRILFQPNNEGKISIAKRLSGLVHRGRMLIDACPEENWRLASINARMSWAWQHLDFAIWHIHDAIREEIYSDPEFICSGSNNHCAK